MKFIKKIPKLTLGLLVTAIILLILAAAVFATEALTQKSVFLEKSTMTVSAEGNQIILQSHLDQKDQSNAEQFLQTIGLNLSGAQKMNFSFDQNTVNNLSQILPATLELNFTGPKELQFSGETHGNIVAQAALFNRNYQLATGSAKLNYQNGNLQIIDPGAVLNYASASGELNLSPKLNSAVTNLGKVSTIEIHIQNDKINGMILLK